MPSAPPANTPADNSIAPATELERGQQWAPLFPDRGISRSATVTDLCGDTHSGYWVLGPGPFAIFKKRATALTASREPWLAGAMPGALDGRRARGMRFYEYSYKPRMSLHWENWPTAVILMRHQSILDVQASEEELRLKWLEKHRLRLNIQ